MLVNWRSSNVLCDPWIESIAEIFPHLSMEAHFLRLVDVARFKGYLCCFLYTEAMGETRWYAWREKGRSASSKPRLASTQKCRNESAADKQKGKKTRSKKPSSSKFDVTAVSNSKPKDGGDAGLNGVESRTRAGCFRSSWRHKVSSGTA